MELFRKIKSFFSSNSHREPDPLTDAQRQKFKIKYEDLGLFAYHDDGFTYKFESGPKRFKWTDIDELKGYKLDRMTIDDICIDIIYGELQFTIYEDTPGWYQFIEKTKKIFPSIPKDWDWTIAFPTFATNSTILYKKEEPPTTA